MNPELYFMPSMRMNRMMGMAPMMRGNYLASRGAGLFSRIGNSLRAFNWKELLSNANRTLNVVNQTIPLIRQTRPMLNNMKSIMQLAKVFRNETSGATTVRGYKKDINIGNKVNTKTNNNDIIKRNDNFNFTDSNLPTFFV